LILQRHFIFSSTYCQRQELSPNLRPSRTTPGIEPTVAWAPTCQRFAGNVLSLWRLCVAPGLLVWWRFYFSWGFTTDSITYGDCVICLYRTHRYVTFIPFSLTTTSIYTFIRISCVRPRKIHPKLSWVFPCFVLLTIFHLGLLLWLRERG
jgi:hypothetical protein